MFACRSCELSDGWSSLLLIFTPHSVAFKNYDLYLELHYLDYMRIPTHDLALEQRRHRLFAVRGIFLLPEIRPVGFFVWVSCSKFPCEHVYYRLRSLIYTDLYIWISAYYTFRKPALVTYTLPANTSARLAFAGLRICASERRTCTRRPWRERPRAHARVKSV